MEHKKTTLYGKWWKKDENTTLRLLHITMSGNRFRAVLLFLFSPFFSRWVVVLSFFSTIFRLLVANKENDPDVDDFTPPPNRPKLTKRMKVFPDQRFLAQKSDEEMKKMVHGNVPPNTAKNKSWAMKVFGDWRAVRNAKLSSGGRNVQKTCLRTQMWPKLTFGCQGLCRRFVNKTESPILPKVLTRF